MDLHLNVWTYVLYVSVCTAVTLEYNELMESSRQLLWLHSKLYPRAKGSRWDCERQAQALGSLQSNHLSAELRPSLLLRTAEQGLADNLHPGYKCRHKSHLQSRVRVEFHYLRAALRTVEGRVSEGLSPIEKRDCEGTLKYTATI